MKFGNASYSAFSYGKSQVSTVVNDIETQEEHHHKQNFVDECKTFLDRFEVEYDEGYLFQAVGG